MVPLCEFLSEGSSLWDWGLKEKDSVPFYLTGTAGNVRVLLKRTFISTCAYLLGRPAGGATDRHCSVLFFFPAPELTQRGRPD